MKKLYFCTIEVEMMVLAEDADDARNVASKFAHEEMMNHFPGEWNAAEIKTREQAQCVIPPIFMDTFPYTARHEDDDGRLVAEIVRSLPTRKDRSP